MGREKLSRPVSVGANAPLVLGVPCIFSASETEVGKYATLAPPSNLFVNLFKSTP